MKNDVFEAKWSQDGSWGDLGSIWVAKRGRLGRPLEGQVGSKKGRKSEAKKGLVLAWSWGGWSRLPLGHLGPVVIRERLSFVSPFVCSSASRSSASVVLRVFGCLLSLLFCRLVSSLCFVFVLPLSCLCSVMALSLFSPRLCLDLAFVLFLFSLLGVNLQSAVFSK